MSFIDFLESSFFQQLAPILVLLVVPACTLLFASRSDDFMGFDNFSLFAPWHWLTGANTAKGSASGRHRHHHRHLSKKHARVPHEAANGSAKPGMLSNSSPKHATNPERRPGRERWLLSWPREYFRDILLHELDFTSMATKFVLCSH
jgi:hypothetical protein